MAPGYDVTQLVSACEGLGTAGDACPIVLPCARGGEASDSGCSVSQFKGAGYNPTAIPVPDDIRRMALSAGYNVSFLGSTRKWRWAEGCRCAACP